MDALYRTYGKPFGLSAVLLAVVLVVFLYFTKPPEEEAPLHAVPAPKLLQYHSATTTITFQYPRAYHREEVDDSSPQRKKYVVTLMEDTVENKAVRDGTTLPREGPIAITVTSYQNDLDNTPLLDWVKGVGDSNWKLGTGAYTTTTVGRIPAVVYDWDGLYRGHTIAVAYGGYIHTFTVTSMEYTDNILHVFDALMETVTFRVPESE